MSDNQARDYRNVMGNFCSGVVVVTSNHSGQPVGFTAQSFVALSLSPELVAICPAKSSTSWPNIRESGQFCVNVLADDQEGISNLFARSGGDKFAGVQWTAGAGGSPVISGSICHIECELEQEVDAGDHVIAIGKVTDMQVHSEQAAPLLFFKGKYGTLAAS